MAFALTREYTGRRLTWQGRLLAGLLVVGLLLGFVAGLYPFLAPNQPQKQGLLVIEGWIHDEALEDALRLYRTGRYSKIVCTGVPIETGSYIVQFKTYPEMTAARLAHLGADPKDVVVAIGEQSRQDRTYTAALALHETLIARNIDEKRIELVTVGPHGRRSRMLFQRALGKDYQVGITCIDDVAYDPKRWYFYSQGMRSVVDEFVAYCYARFVFRP